MTQSKGPPSTMTLPETKYVSFFCMETGAQQEVGIYLGFSPPWRQDTSPECTFRLAQQQWPTLTR